MGLPWQVPFTLRYMAAHTHNPCSHHIISPQSSDTSHSPFVWFALLVLFFGGGSMPLLASIKTTKTKRVTTQDQSINSIRMSKFLTHRLGPSQSWCHSSRLVHSRPTKKNELTQKRIDAKSLFLNFFQTYWEKELWWNSPLPPASTTPWKCTGRYRRVTFLLQFISHLTPPHDFLQGKKILRWIKWIKLQNRGMVCWSRETLNSHDENKAQMLRFRFVVEKRETD